MRKKDEIKLKVAEARPNDIGRGIVRIDPFIQKKMNLETGDIVKIIGKGETVAKVWPGFPNDELSNTIRIDGMIRRNADVGIDENVILEKIGTKTAKKITFAPTQQLKIMGGEEYLQQVLEGRVLSKGDLITINVMGRKIDLIVNADKSVSMDGNRFETIKECESYIESKPRLDI